MHDLIIQDAEQKERAYRGLARHYLSQGDAWLAVHAQVLADVYAATVIAGGSPANLMDENTGRPALAHSLEQSKALRSATSPVEAVHAVRMLVETALGDLESKVWHQYIDDLSSFEAFDGPLGTDQVVALREARLGGLTGEQFIESRRSTASDSYHLAAVHRQDGNHWGAIVATYEGDLATYESWLVQRSLEVGDDLLIQTEFKWTLAVATLEQVGTLPADELDASQLVRSRLAWAAGPQDAHTLVALFPPIA